MASQVIALIADLGGDRGAGTSYYYNIGSRGGGNTPTDSLGPGAETVANLVRSWNPTDVLAIGDQTYSVAGSTLVDTAIGKHFNDFMHPYPSPYYLEDDYLSIGGNPIIPRAKTWPYNIYDFPNGFPNPSTGGIGGSADGRNHYWGTLGNHEYGEAVGYGQVGVTPYDFGGTDIGSPIAPSSGRVPGATIDYAMPWLLDPTLLGEDQDRLNVGHVDITGNSGTYYSISFGDDEQGAPVLEVFNLDTGRFNINAGFENWNPSGLKTKNADGSWSDAVRSNKEYSITYDPTNPDQVPLNGTTTDEGNAYAQFSWLKESLASSNAKWKIITGHHPVYTSGQWGTKQPNAHMSIPYLQKLLNALPEGSFDAWFNGHDHYYERVLEQNPDGIGQGIPFITNGNSGRILYRKAQVPYGTSVYTPISPGTSNEAVVNELLPSDPASVGSSGLGQDGSNDTAGISPGIYAYGFGGTRTEFDNDYLYFNYQQAPMIDPAIANHLADGKNPQAGFAGTKSTDWIPNPEGNFSGLPDLAYFGIEVTDGVVTDVQIVNGGSGYMSSKGGNHTVTGFNIYGNNTDLVQPWLNTAQVDLTFSGGVLTNVSLTDGGSGYELAAGAALGSNTATGISLQPDAGNEWKSLRIPLNYRLNESIYLTRDNNSSDYQDWYLITDTSIAATSLNQGAYGGLNLTVTPSSDRAQEILTNQEITPGYSGSGQQNKYSTPQQGDITVVDSTGSTVGTGNISNGIANFELNRLAAPGTINVNFSGDSASSYLTNFKESSRSLTLNYGTWDSGITLDPNTNAISFGSDVSLALTRTDVGNGTISFGLESVSDGSTALVLNNAAAANGEALTSARIFTEAGSGSWLASEGKTQGGFAASNSGISAGSYKPVAIDSNGNRLAVRALSSFGNTINATFAGGVSARYSTEATGVATNLPGTGAITVTVQRLGANSHGLGFYAADPITGAVTLNGDTFQPGDAGYLDAAYQLASQSGLLLQANQLPDYEGTSTFSNLALTANQSYGLLLDRGGRGDDLISSFANANPNESIQSQTFEALNRGVVYGFEDLRPWEDGYDSDFNDIIVTLSGAGFSIV